MDRNRLVFEKRDLLLFQNVELVELIGIYKKIIGLTAEWDSTKIKEQFIEEIITATFARGCVIYLYDEKTDQFVCDSYRGMVEAVNLNENLNKKDVDESPPEFYLNSKQINIPLKLEDRIYGLIKIVEPVIDEGFSEKEFNKAFCISEFFPLILENAKKIELLQRYTIKDEKINAYFWDLFKDFIKKEIYKSLRYDRKLSIIGIELENLEELKKRHKEQDIREHINEITSIIQGLIRDSDWFVERQENSYLLFLTETDYFGALMAIRRIRQALVGKGILKTARSVEEIAINIAAVGLPIHGTNLDDLLNSLKEKMEQNRKSLYFKLDFSKESFEKIVANILEYKEKENTHFFCWYREQNEEIFGQILMLMLNDVKINSKRRGILYSSVNHIERGMLLNDKKNFINVTTKIYLFWHDKTNLPDIPGIVNVNVEKKIYEHIKFLLFLNENFAYGLLKMGDQTFETSDHLLVEGLINKLQAEHYLQWQL